MKSYLLEFPKYCIVCGKPITEHKLEPVQMKLMADNEKHSFIVWLCVDHEKTTPDQVQEIVSDNINLASF